MKQLVKSETEAPSILLRNVEKLAIQIHQQYIDTTTYQYEEKKANGELDDDLIEKYEGLVSFNELSSHLKIANIRQARSIPSKLRIIGCELANKNDPREEITEFTQEEVNDLAMLEHDEWCEEKIKQGWVYGEERDDEKMIHNYLVPWDDLSPEIQQYDIDPILNIPKLVQSVGLKIVISRIRMLTIEMHKFYSEGNENEADFEDLPDYIKYSNYRQADFLVKILGELGYDVVEKDSKGDSLEYLAQREHEAWRSYKLNLGWTYDSVKDDEQKFNPNLVKWDVLDDSVKESNMHTFKNLPILCDKVNLKIVKN